MGTWSAGKTASLWQAAQSHALACCFPVAVRVGTALEAAKEASDQIVTNNNEIRVMKTVRLFLPAGIFFIRFHPVTEWSSRMGQGRRLLENGPGRQAFSRKAPSIKIGVNVTNKDWRVKLNQNAKPAPQGAGTWKSPFPDFAQRYVFMVF